MIYPVVKYGDDVLTAKAATVEVFDKELEKLVDDMFESMYAANGVGLAAPQIGISRRIAVIDCSVGKDPKAKIVIINPEIIAKEGKQSEEEGCLSIPGFRESVTRPNKPTRESGVRCCSTPASRPRNSGLRGRRMCRCRSTPWTQTQSS